MPFRSCVVSFVERGQRQEAHVDAETAFEACVLALKFWSTRRFVRGPGRHATLHVEINKPARLLIDVKVSKVLEWLYVRPPANADAEVRIRRLRALLADDRH